MIIKKRNTFRTILLGVLLFYIIYTPSLPNVWFLDKNVLIPTITAAVLMFSLIKNKGKPKTKPDKYKLVFSIILLVADLYALFIYAINNEFDFMESRIVQNLLPFCYLYLVSKIFANMTRKQIFDMLVNLAVIQGVITLLMLIFPTLHSISLALFDLDNPFVTAYRVYGVTTDFTYATPIYHGFLAALLVYKWLLKEEKVNLIKLTFIVLAIVMNGRTGLLILFIDIIIFMIGYIFKKANITKVILYTTIGLVMSFAAYWGVSIFLPQTSQFINKFASDTVSYFIEGEASGNYEILEKSVSIPSGSELVFGKGLRLYKTDRSETGYKKTDIGYMNDIFLGGLIYSGLMYFAYLYFMGKNIKDRLVLFALVITMAIVNIKGEAFRSSILFFMMIAIPIMESKELGYETK